MIDIYGMRYKPDLYQGRQRRTKREYPYSYDPFTVWGRGGDRANGSTYSDRLAQWDSKKYEELRLKHKPQFNGQGDKEALQAFLRDFHGIPDLELLEVQEHCNWSSGYPVWLYIYHYDHAAAEKRSAAASPYVSHT